MNDFLTDEELDRMMEAGPQQAQGAPIVPVADYPPEPVPLYSLQLAQAQMNAPNANGAHPQHQPIGQVQGNEGLFLKKVGPLPVWGWGLIALGVTGTGYFAYKASKAKSKPKANGDDSGESAPKIGEILSKALSANADGGGSSWSPSRSGFTDRLNNYFQKKGQSAHVKVWHDAEDAKEKGGLKFVSPLINIQVKHGSVKLDQALTRFCRREGLNPQQHPDGSIGLYPHSSKRGKEWEEYVDALRDDGQTI